MDILVFAVVAIVLCYRLYTILGRDDDPISQEVFSDVPKSTLEKANPRDKLDQLLRRHHIPLFLKPAFSAILLKDPTFDIKDFLAGAEGAYELILTHAFLGDLGKIESYISPAAKAQLSTITQRERFRIKVIRIDIVGAEFELPVASITVQFKSMVKNVQRQEDWVFTRDLIHNDPTWILKEILTINAA